MPQTFNHSDTALCQELWLGEFTVIEGGISEVNLKILLINIKGPFTKHVRRGGEGV